MNKCNLEEYGNHGSCPACCAILSHGHGRAPMVQRRVADLLSQNIPPSDDEAHDLLHTDLDTAPYLAQIEQRMAELTNELARLSTTRAHLQRHPQLLREIFLCSAQSWNDKARSEIRDSLYLLRPEWVLSQVCHRWRDVALSFPRLWSSLDLNLGRFYIDPSPMSRSRLRLTAYLDRSANQKMTVRISIVSPFLHSDIVHLGPLLRQSTSRWVDCRFDTSFEFLDVIFANCDFGSLARLHVFKNAPLLRSLDYRNSYYPDDLVELPWEQLITVKVAEVTDPFALSPLRRLMHVQCLALRLAGLDFERDTILLLSLSPLHLPSVTSLRLSGLFEEDAEQIGQLISSLEMPSITELELAFGWSPGSELDATITFPPFHSSVYLGQLTALSIICQLEEDANGVDKLVAFLRLTPNLHRFRLCDSDISSAVFDAMTLRDGHSNLLPCLRILDIKGCDLNKDVGITHILSTLESRCLLSGKETNSRSGLKQLFLSPSISQKIIMLCVDDGIRGRWDEISTSILIR
ncbi:hypothetical protein BDZ89DRAFT_1071170 [Hymenopellis radicata]|nr:hypothetical protein BDZ89DRAFT_1071170 [Hymenopellis radicata]